MRVILPINKNITSYNYNNGVISRIKYLVIHYTGNNGDTAYNNTEYFKSYRGSSAHYFVDENSIWSSIEDKNIAWHCGTSGKYKHAYCRNSNSIGIELCSRLSNGVYYFKNATVSNAIDLTHYLMKLYNIPIENIIRHYDVTGKICPVPFVQNEAQWHNYLANLVNKFDNGEKEVKKYNKISEIPVWAQSTIQKFVDKGYLNGDETGNLDLTYSDIRMIVIQDRMNPRYDYIDEMPVWAQPIIEKLVNKGALLGNDNGVLDLSYSDLKVFTINDRMGLYD